MVENIEQTGGSNQTPIGQEGTLPSVGGITGSEGPAILRPEGDALTTTPEVTDKTDQVVPEVNAGETTGLTPDTTTEKPQSDSEEKPADDGSKTPVEPVEPEQSSEKTTDIEPDPKGDGDDPKTPKDDETPTGQPAHALSAFELQQQAYARQRYIARTGQASPSNVISEPDNTGLENPEDPGKTPKENNLIIKRVLGKKWIVRGVLSVLGLLALVGGVGTFYGLRQGEERVAGELATPTASAAAGTPLPEVLPTQIPAEPTAIPIPEAIPSSAPDVTNAYNAQATAANAQATVLAGLEEVYKMLTPAGAETPRSTATQRPTAPAVLDDEEATRTPEPTWTQRPTATPRPTETQRPTATATTITRPDDYTVTRGGVVYPLEEGRDYTYRHLNPRASTIALGMTVVAGDVEINGISINDRDPETGLVVLIDTYYSQEKITIKAPFGADVLSVTNQDPSIAKQLAHNKASEMIEKGCERGHGCKTVRIVFYPGKQETR